MKILIAGSHGMIGAVVARRLAEQGHEIVRLVRGKPQAGELHWDPDRGEIDARQLEGFDAIIHLATMPWPMRWTARNKQAMLTNRLATNGVLSRALAGCENRPRVLVCASGMGYYASSGDDVITEETPCGTSFLARLQRDGEAATESASRAGIRVVHLRIPPVVGGAAVQRPAFQAGDGRQWISWVGLDELACIVAFALTSESLYGPVNAVSPNPMRGSDFAAVSRAALEGKPGFTLPAFLLRTLMGEMGEELLLSSRRIQPAKLLAAGYRFRFPDLASAVRHEKALYALLNKTQKQSVSTNS